jgi:hypothetical protein
MARAIATVIVIAVGAALARARSESAFARQPLTISGIVHEAKPTTDTMIAGARIEAIRGELAGLAFTTSADGTFVLPPVVTLGFALKFEKDGYETAQLDIKESSRDGMLDVTMMPERRDIILTRSGDNDCADLPMPPEGVPGLREYARLAVHHDGGIVVTSAHLPFFGNQGYVYRLTPAGWIKNEFDYVLLRNPIPVQGGFVYVITFGGDKDLCGRWSLEAAHPS